MNTDNLITCVIEGIENVKGLSINILDLRDIENMACKLFIVCSGSSSTQVNAIQDQLENLLVKKWVKSLGMWEGLENSKWVLMDT